MINYSAVSSLCDEPEYVLWGLRQYLTTFYKHGLITEKDKDGLDCVLNGLITLKQQTWVKKND